MLCLWVLKPFFAPIVWAAILAYVSWPLYRRLRSAAHEFNATAALLMTVFVTCLVVVPMLWLLILIREEFINAAR